MALETLSDGKTYIYLRPGECLAHELNDDIKTRDEIIFGSFDESKYTNNARSDSDEDDGDDKDVSVSLSDAKKLIDLGYVLTPDKSYDGKAPSVNKLLDFMSQYEGYSFDSVYAYKDNENNSCGVLLCGIQKDGPFSSEQERKDYKKLTRSTEYKNPDQDEWYPGAMWGFDEFNCYSRNIVNRNRFSASNKDIRKRDIILFGNYDKERYEKEGDCVRFYDLSLSGLKKLINSEFIADLDLRFNSRPTVREFFEFMKKYPNYRVSGFAKNLTPNRDDYDVNIDSIYRTKECTDKEELKAFKELAKNADEKSIKKCSAWWD